MAAAKKAAKPAAATKAAAPALNSIKDSFNKTSLTAHQDRRSEGARNAQAQGHQPVHQRGTGLRDQARDGAHQGQVPDEAQGRGAAIALAGVSTGAGSQRCHCLASRSAVPMLIEYAVLLLLDASPIDSAEREKSRTLAQ